MRSKDESDLGKLNLPEPTWVDIQALERAERANRLDGSEYLDFLLRVTRDVPAPRYTNTDTDEPFEL
jgi:hypothetical protein